MLLLLLLLLPLPPPPLLIFMLQILLDGSTKLSGEEEEEQLVFPSPAMLLSLLRLLPLMTAAKLSLGREVWLMLMLLTGEELLVSVHMFVAMAALTILTGKAATGEGEGLATPSGMLISTPTALLMLVVLSKMVLLLPALLLVMGQATSFPNAPFKLFITPLVVVVVVRFMIALLVVLTPIEDDPLIDVALLGPIASTRAPETDLPLLLLLLLLIQLLKLLMLLLMVVVGVAAVVERLLMVVAVVLL